MGASGTPVHGRVAIWAAAIGQSLAGIRRPDSTRCTTGRPIFIEIS